MKCGFSCTSLFDQFIISGEKCEYENDENDENCTTISKIIPFYRTLWLMTMELHEHHYRITAMK